MPDIYRYVNRGGTLVDTGSNQVPPYSSTNFETTQPDLDVLDGITLDRYVNGVPTLREYTPYGIVLPKAKGYGIKVDLDNPSWGWRDLIGDITPKTSGVGSPTLAVLTGNIRSFNYAAGEDGDCIYHIPHDYVPGTDMYLHAHWTHNGTNISGSLVINTYMTYAKGHQQANFHTQKTLVITDGGLNITNTPALRHRVPEFRATISGGSASQLDTDIIETDGIIIVHYDVDTIPNITGGTGKPFLLTFDLHYMSNNASTKNKSPDFWS